MTVSRLLIAGIIAAALVSCRSGAAEEPTTQPSTKPAEDKHTTASGLTIVEVKEGTGAAAKAGDTVAVHYTGRLESNGKQFDSSIGGKPISFTLGARQVIAGWDEGIAGMKVGGKRQLIIPAKLGYGDQGFGDAIPPGATLIFDVELMKIGE